MEYFFSKIMFYDKIKQLSESDKRYLKQQIKKLNEYNNNPLATQDTLYRIATNAELFPPNQLSLEAKLTPQQTRVTWAFIRYLKGLNQKNLLEYFCQIIKF